MTKETFAKASKVVDKPLNVKIDIRLCTNIHTYIYIYIYTVPLIYNFISTRVAPHGFMCVKC